jgi:pyruvate/2-oxoglutarate dehydrogenase complex dihydrolipoamide dehydrogenase (E3) component
MGCRERPRGALGIPGFRPQGVYTAGTAQKLVNLEGAKIGKEVVILGSGDIGLIMARRMTLQGAHVLACVEIMPYSSGLNRNIVQCLQDYDIPLYLSHTVTDIRGKDRLEAVTVAQVDRNRKPVPGTEKEIKCDTLLLSCGLIPENELSAGAGVLISPATSGAFVNERFETSVEGIFACGNVLHVHDLVDHVSDESCLAGKAAADYVMHGYSGETGFTVQDGNGVRGVVPQRITTIPQNDVRLMFRPADVYRNAAVVVECNDVEIARKKAMIFTPGEMVSVMISRKDLCQQKEGHISVHIEGEKRNE